MGITKLADLIRSYAPDAISYKDISDYTGTDTIGDGFSSRSDSVKEVSCSCQPLMLALSPQLLASLAVIIAPDIKETFLKKKKYYQSTYHELKATAIIIRLSEVVINNLPCPHYFSYVNQLIRQSNQNICILVFILIQCNFISAENTHTEHCVITVLLILFASHFEHHNARNQMLSELYMKLSIVQLFTAEKSHKRIGKANPTSNLYSTNQRCM